MCPFVSVDTGQVMDTKWRKRFIRTFKSLVGNTIKYFIRQLDVLGLLPQYISGLANLIIQSYKGHVTIVPSPSLKDYANLLKNVDPTEFKPNL